MLPPQVTARHPHGTRRWLLPLLPSGPDGVRNLPLRGTRLSLLAVKKRMFAQKKNEDIFPFPDKTRKSDLKCSGGEGGIRTPGSFHYTRFPGEHHRPLGHLSAGWTRYTKGSWV